MRHIPSPTIARVATADGLYLHGFFQPGDPKKLAVLFIHGFEGNFYQDHFANVCGAALRQHDITWLPINTRGNGKDTDINTVDGSSKTIGARFELLEEAYLDIDAWVELLVQAGYQRIALMGHSLGCFKVVRYMAEGRLKQHIERLVLLSPFDSKSALELYAHQQVEQLLQRAKSMVAAGKGREVITTEFDTIQISYQSFISWYEQHEFNRCFEFSSASYDFPALKRIAIPTKIIVGSQDEYFHQSNPTHPQEAMDLMLRVIPHSEGLIIPGAVHSFHPHEDKLAEEVVQFVSE